MVLVLPSTGPIADEDDPLQSILGDPQVQQANAAFLGRLGEAPVPASSRSACALMGEQALVDFSDRPWHVGSTDATTCLIVVAVCPTTCKAWAAHYNSSLAARDVSILRLLPLHMKHPEVWLVGSFRECSGESAATLGNVLELLQSCPLPFRVRLACVDTANTDDRGAPRALNLAVRCAPPQSNGTVAGASAGAGSRDGSGDGCGDGDASPAGFLDRGPELPRRFAHDYLSVDHDSAEGPLRSIVDTATSRLRVPGLRCRWPHPGLVAHYALQLGLPDKAFLRNNSTSPEHEPPNFVEDIKACYRYMLEQVKAGVQVIADAHFEWVDGGGKGVEDGGLGSDSGQGAVGVSGWRPLPAGNA